MYMKGVRLRMKNSTPGPVAYHDALAGDWNDRYCRGGFARRERFVAREILPILPSDGLWLDVGCGSGTFSRMLLQGGRHVVGVDASAKMLKEATQRAGNSAGRLSFQDVETAEALPFPARQFEGVICFSVLEYLERPDVALAEMTRVLKPGGTLAFSVPHRLSALRRAQSFYGRFRRQPDSGHAGYLAFSRFSSVPEEIEEKIGRLEMTLQKSLGFDPFVPRRVHWMLKPSLIYVVCEKLREPPLLSGQP